MATAQLQETVWDEYGGPSRTQPMDRERHSLSPLSLGQGVGEGELDPVRGRHPDSALAGSVGLEMELCPTCCLHLLGHGGCPGRRVSRSPGVPATLRLCFCKCLDDTTLMGPGEAVSASVKVTCRPRVGWGDPMG